jgi:hypothetical protein
VPLRPPVRLGGILLAPLPDIFELREATYRENEKPTLLNATIFEEDGWRTIAAALAGREQCSESIINQRR